MAEQTKYLRGQIEKMFNISREALRYLERKKVLAVDQSGDNNYRKYTSSDINIITEALRYKSLGFTVEQSKDMIYNYDFPQIANKFREHVNDLEHKMIMDKLLYQKAQRDLQGLQFLETHMNSFFEQKMNAMYFIPFDSGSTKSSSKPLIDAYDKLQFYSVGFCWNKNSESPELKNGAYGLITEQRFATLIGAEGGYIRKESSIICKMIDVAGDDFPEEKMFHEFKADITRQYNREFEEIYVILITRFYDNNGILHKYCVIFAPLE